MHTHTQLQVNSSTYVGRELFWDSGKVASNSSTYVAYTGPALDPGTRYTWSVRTWTAPAEFAAGTDEVAGARRCGWCGCAAVAR